MGGGGTKFNVHVYSYILRVLLDGTETKYINKVVKRTQKPFRDMLNIRYVSLQCLSLILIKHAHSCLLRFKGEERQRRKRETYLFFLFCAPQIHKQIETATFVQFPKNYNTIKTYGGKINRRFRLSNYKTISRQSTTVYQRSQHRLTGQTQISANPNLANKKGNVENSDSGTRTLLIQPESKLCKSKVLEPSFGS